MHIVSSPGIIFVVMFSPFLNIAIQAARCAAAIITRASFDIDPCKVIQKQSGDFVTEVDIKAQKAIVEIIQNAYPEHAILAEESHHLSTFMSDLTNDLSDFLWIIDPLDGTTNFIHSFPHYCVSIALQQRGQVTQAVIYDPTRNELFTASKGGGAYLNDKRIRVSKRDRLTDALIGTWLSINTDKAAIVKKWRIVTEQSAACRRSGSAALDLAYVATGRLDAFFERGLKLWDIAAGTLLVTEAGGIVGNFAGDSLHWTVEGVDILAGNPRIFGQIVRVLST